MRSFPLRGLSTQRMERVVKVQLDLWRWPEGDERLACLPGLVLTLSPERELLFPLLVCSCCFSCADASMSSFKSVHG